MLVLFTHFAHAADASNGWFGIPTLGEMLADAAAWISTMMLNICSIFLMITGALLNTSIIMTMHIKDFVDNTPGVYLVWQTIRDVSGMFIIFMLLYASFKIIIGFDTVGGVGNLIKNIVIAGVLINFSFFITSLLIDASNIVSLALYQGIMGDGSAQEVKTVGSSSNCQTSNGQPAGPNNTCSIISSMIENPSTETAGMSAIFLNILKPQSIYKTNGGADTTNTPITKALMILIQGIVGCGLMLIASFSFLFASIAFIVRLVTLIILLGFSPIWFAAWVVPKLDDQAKKFTDLLKSNLIFMPVYLLLLYASLRFISSSSMFTNPGASIATSTTAGLGMLPTNYMTLAINDFFAIFLLNLPLVAALMLGGATTEMANKWTNSVKGWSKKQVQGSARIAATSTWRNTGGRVASRIARSDAFQTYAGKSIIGQYALKATRSVGKEFDTKLDTRIKEREDFAKSLNRSGATAYADRLTNSTLSKATNKLSTGLGRIHPSMAGAVGRADRVGAASILKSRQEEINAEREKLNSEYRKYKAIQTGGRRGRGGRALNAYEQERMDKLEGTNISGTNTIDPATGNYKNEITDADSQYVAIQNQIRGPINPMVGPPAPANPNSFESQTGSNIKDTTKRKY